MKDIVRNKGKMIMLYGETGSGKSTTCLGSLPEPILNIYTEDRDPYTSIEGLGREIDFDPIAPDKYDDFIKYLYDVLSDVKAGKCKYKSIMVDSLSYYMNIKLYGEMVDEAKDAGTFNIASRPLVNSVRADQPLYGGLAENMQRLIQPLKKIGQAGLIVVTLAYLDENPKWDRALSAAPSFIGKAWNTNYQQHYDVIGKLSNNIDKDGQIQYPPIITVRSNDDSFVAKWTGKHIQYNSYPLDFKKMLGVE